MNKRRIFCQRRLSQVNILSLLNMINVTADLSCKKEYWDGGKPGGPKERQALRLQMTECAHTQIDTGFSIENLGATLYINHPSSQPHLLLSTATELFTRQTVPEGKSWSANWLCTSCVCIRVRPLGQTGVTSQTKTPPAAVRHVLLRQETHTHKRTHT